MGYLYLGNQSQHRSNQHIVVVTHNTISTSKNHHLKPHLEATPNKSESCRSDQQDQTLAIFCAFCALQDTMLAIVLCNINRTNMKCICLIKLENVQCNLRSLENVSMNEKCRKTTTDWGKCSSLQSHLSRIRTCRAYTHIKII